MIQIVTREELENDKTIDRMIKEDECAWLTALGRRHRSLLEKEGKFPRKIVTVSFKPSFASLSCFRY